MKQTDDKKKIIVRNKRASFEYHILERYEAGIALTGTEIKSIRQGNVSLQEAYCRIDDGEVHLVKAHIAEYGDRGYANHDPLRKRKLLLHRREIRKLEGKIQQRGLTLVPLSLYLVRGLAKVEIGLVRGKKLHDKRETMKKREARREIERNLGGGR